MEQELLTSQKVWAMNDPDRGKARSPCPLVSFTTADIGPVIGRSKKNG